MEFEEFLISAYLFSVIIFSIMFFYWTDFTRKSHKFLVVSYGFALVIFSIWFWLKYGLSYENFSIPIPPITTIIVFVGFFTMLFLMLNNGRIQNVFGTNKADVRKLLLKALGTIFTGFVLMITILWGLMAGGLEMYPRVVYIQSFLLVLLFFFIAGSFYCILADLKQ